MPDARLLVGNGAGWGGDAKGLRRFSPEEGSRAIWARFCSPEARVARLARIEEMIGVLEHHARHGETEHVRVVAAEKAAAKLIDADRHAAVLERMLAPAAKAEEAPRITVVVRDVDRDG